MSSAAVAEAPGAEPVDPRLGTTLNERYRITRKIGEGGMGLVYEGEHLIIRRRVAIKMLHAHMSQNPEVAARFRREAIAATSIRHPHIIEVLDMGTAPDGAAYMVLEFLDGRDWSHDIEASGPQPLGRVVKIMREVCDGLQAAHDKGIVHRDLKPENVFLTRHGDRADFVKIVDFGISKIMDEAEAAGGPGDKKQHSLTKTGAAMGTPYSMAPEQLKGARDVDHRADIWALGVMLFHGLTGGYPFDGETFPMLAVNVLTGDPPPLARFRGDLPPEIQQVLDALLQKDKTARFQSARDVRNALAPFEGFGLAPQVVENVAHVAMAATQTPMPHASSGIQHVTQQLGGAQPVANATGPMLPNAAAAIGVPRTAITPAGLVATGTPAAMPAAAAPGGAATGEFGTTTAPALPPAKNNTPMIIGGLVVAALVGVGATVAVTSGGPATPPATAATEAPAPTPAPAPPPVTPDPPPTPPPSPTVAGTAAPAAPTVRVQITTVPEGAELFLDGNPIGNPFDADLPSNTEVHHLEARMTGRVTASRNISLAFPQRIVLELEREGGSGSRGGRGSSGGSSTTSVSPPATGGSSGGSTTTAAAPARDPDPPPARDPDPPPAADPPATGGSSGGRTLRDPFRR